MVRILGPLRRALWRGFEHDVFAIAKAAAFSSILTFFPALLAVASILATTEGTREYLDQIGDAIGNILPSGSGTATSYFETAQRKPIGTLVLMSLVTLWTASGIFVSWMDGFRRAFGLPKTWGLLKERLVAFFLVFLTFVPMVFATVLVVFGNQFETWMVFHSGHELGFVILAFWGMVRWVIAMATSVMVLQLIYHWAVPRTEPWHNALPGAGLATGLWFPATYLFGWYVRHFSTYSIIYGSLATAIALLVWMYIISVIILLGAEFNAQVFPKTVMSSAPAPAQKRELQVR